MSAEVRIYYDAKQGWMGWPYSVYIADSSEQASYDARLLNIYCFKWMARRAAKRIRRRMGANPSRDGSKCLVETF